MDIKKCDKCGGEGAIFKLLIVEGSVKLMSVFGRQESLLKADLCRTCSEKVRSFVFNIDSIRTS